MLEHLVDPWTALRHYAAPAGAGRDRRDQPPQRRPLEHLRVPRQRDLAAQARGHLRRHPPALVHAQGRARRCSSRPACGRSAVVRRRWLLHRGSRFDRLAPPITLFTFQHVIAATYAPGLSDRDPLPGDPHAVPGGPRELLPDRRRPAHAGRRRAELGDVAGRARSGPRNSTAARSSSSSGSSSPTSTPTTSGWSASSPSAAAPRSARSTCCSRWSRTSTATPSATTASRSASCAATACARTSSTCSARCRAPTAAGAAAPPSPTRSRTEASSASRAARFTVLHRPGHSPTDTILFDPEDGTCIAGDHLIGHISSNPLIALPPTGDPGGERPKSLLIYIDSLEQTRAMPITTVLPGHGAELRRPRAADRRALRAARAPRGQAAGPDRRAPAQRARARPGAVGRRRGHAGAAHAERGARPRRPAPTSAARPMRSSARA